MKSHHKSGKKDFLTKSLEQGLLTISPKGVMTRNIAKTLQSKEGKEIARKFLLTSDAIKS